MKPRTPTAGGQPLDLMMWEIGRAYYAYVGLAERILAEAGLGKQIQPGMGLVLFSLYEQDDRTIKEIAAQTGFEDAHYFSRVFKKKTGRSPEMWRQLYQANSRKARR